MKLIGVGKLVKLLNVYKTPDVAKALVYVMQDNSNYINTSFFNGPHKHTLFFSQ